jgi:hypothetical protein
MGPEHQKPSGLAAVPIKENNNKMRDNNRGVIEDHAALDAHYTAIATIMQYGRLWRNHWAVELNGCVYKFDMKGYAKRGSEIWKEQQEELKALDDA